MKDNGPGLPDTELKICFGSFTATKKAGVGIGLTMCRDIFRAQRGNMVVANNSNEPGCIFQFTLLGTDFGGGETVDLKLVKSPTEFAD